MAFISKEVFIRLADDYSALVCTVRYGKIYSKTAHFSVNDRSIVENVDGVAAVPVNDRPPHRVPRQVISRSDD